MLQTTPGCGQCPRCPVPGGGCHRLRQPHISPGSWSWAVGPLAEPSHSGSQEDLGSQLGGSCNLWSRTVVAPCFPPLLLGSASLSLGPQTPVGSPTPTLLQHSLERDPLSCERLGLEHDARAFRHELSFASLAVPGFFLACLCSVTLAPSEHFHGSQPWSLP